MSEKRAKSVARRRKRLEKKRRASVVPDKTHARHELSDDVFKNHPPAKSDIQPKAVFDKTVWGGRKNP